MQTISRQEFRTAIAVGLRNAPRIKNNERYRLFDVAQESKRATYGRSWAYDSVDIRCPALQAVVNVGSPDFAKAYDTWLIEHGYDFPDGILNVID